MTIWLEYFFKSSLLTKFASLGSKVVIPLNKGIID